MGPGFCRQCDNFGSKSSKSACDDVENDTAWGADAWCARAGNRRTAANDLYARLARLREIDAIDDFAEEIEDRFGPPPARRTQSARHRPGSGRWRGAARRAGAVRIDAEPRGIAVAFDVGEAKHQREIAVFRRKDARLVSDRPRAGMSRCGRADRTFRQSRSFIAGCLETAGSHSGSARSSPRSEAGADQCRTRTRAARRYANPACARGLPHPLGATWTGRGVNFALFSAQRDKGRAVPVRRGRHDRDRAHRAARIHRRGLARVFARRASRHDLRLSGIWPVRTGERPSLQPEQAAARPLCQGAARPARMEPGAVRLHDGERRRFELRRARQRPFHAEMPRRRSGVHLGRRPSAAHGVGAHDRLRAARARLHDAAPGSPRDSCAARSAA